jgi:cytochrome c oxidase subunit 2
MAMAGGKLFENLGCANCHHVDGSGRGPSLVGLFGKKALLTGGQSVIADEAYLRESILNPGAKVVAGYQPIMPTFQGQASEEGLLQIIAYIRSLERSGPTGTVQ